MVILKKPIPGYNNILRTATDNGMKFGVNSSLNYRTADTAVQKKHQPTAPTHHLEILSTPSTPPEQGVTKPLVRKHNKTAPISINNNTELVAVIVASVVGGYLVSAW